MPAGIELATAYVSLVASTSDMARDLRRDLEQAGDRAGREAGEGFADQFTRQTRGMDRDVSRRLGDVGGDEGQDAGRRFSSGFSERLSGIGDSIGDRLGGAADRVSGMAGDSGGASFLSGFSGQIGSLGSKAGPIGAALAGVAAIGVSAGAVLAGAIADGMQQQQQRDLIQARLGVNEATMDTIGKAAGGSFSNAFGESVQANMETAQLAIQSGILSGEESAGQMQPVLEGLQGVTDLMGGEMSDTVRAVSSLMKNNLVGSSEEAFDVITRGYQRGGNIADDLIDSLSEYGDGWEQTGFSGEFAMGLIIQSMDNGADSTDRAADAMREFGRRMSEEGDTIKGAIGDLGLPVEELFSQLEQGGPKGEAAFDRIFDAIRQIESPTERAAAAQAFLGDTAGDFINSLANWDPSQAAASFGVVEGAAQSARDTMSSNPMSEWTSSMNTIKVEADNVKLALADMAGPYLAQLAEWVSTHKPEIIGFFTGLVDGALLAGEGIARFVQGALNVIGPFAAITSEAFAGVLDTMGGFVSAAAKVAGALGMDGLSSDLEGAASFLGDYADKSRSVSGSMLTLADTIGEDVIPAMSGMRAGLKDAGQQAQDSALLMRALGDGVEMIPDEKRIIIKDNTPERREELEKLGLTVTELPDGTFQVTANTAEGQRIVDNFIAANNGKNVDVWVTLKQRREAAGIDPNFVGPTLADSGLATGGYFTGKGTGTSDSNLVWLSNGEFVANAAATKRHRGLLEAINNGDLPAFAAGGYFNAEAAVGRAKSKAGRPYDYASLDDCSGHLSDVFNAGTGQGVRFTTASNFEAMGWVRGYDPNGFSIGTNKGVGENGHMAGTLFGVNIESDGSNGVQYGGSADGAMDFPFVYHWPGASGGDDPTMEDLGSGRASVTGIDGLTPFGSGTTGGGGSSGGSGGGSGGSGGSSGKPSDAVSVFVTNWPNGTSTVEKISADGTTTSSYSTPSTTAEGARAEPNPYEERLRQYGEQMAGIGQSAALEILGVEGTLLDPNHRFWTAGREIAQAFAQQNAQAQPAASGEANVDRSINIQSVQTVDVQQLIRQLQILQQTQARAFTRG